MIFVLIMEINFNNQFSKDNQNNFFNNLNNHYNNYTINYGDLALFPLDYFPQKTFSQEIGVSTIQKLKNKKLELAIPPNTGQAEHVITFNRGLINKITI